MYTYANWPYYYASGLSAVNAIGTQLRDQISSGLTRKRLALWMDAVAESGRRPGQASNSAYGTISA